MSSLDIKLPDSLDRFVARQVTERGYRDPSDYLRALIESDQMRAVRDELEAKLLAASNSASTEMTPEDWQDIRTEGMQHLRGPTP